ncbi:hypothetical protein SAMN05444143_10169 [Flavobacterium succinicans]|uniref:Uncharacterized protein n=1 Tax=Flavobacterium succinicans TaxID=29536 RepID=A0A1I4QW92_9FLAO|nr:hypothetical protein [Flavobacterium succinicans]SFM43980.1 hypothetical protein SAMN05444143_10169 [Flavobacterium succinicans]
MKIYLDNNIFTSVEQNDYEIDKIRKLFNDEEIIFPFSAAHLQEANNITAATEEQRIVYLQKRFDTISRITQDFYIYHQLFPNEILWQTRKPKQVFETITDDPFSQIFMKFFTSFISAEKKEEIREKIGIDVKELNNYKPKEAIEHLNTKLTVWETGESFLELIENAKSLFKNTSGFGLHNDISAVISLLDMFGYWKDRPTKNSDYARLWDSSHAHYASHCDYLISDDRRLRYKARVVYDLYNIKTKIISSNGEEDN